MTTYKIIKSYEGFPSKTRTVETGLNLEDAKSFITYTASQWTKHGGLVLDQIEMCCVLEEGDASNEITYGAHAE